MVTDNDSKVVLFADDTNIIITSPNQEGLQIALTKTLSEHFLKNSILNTWYINKIEFVIGGDININYLENCKKRPQLDALLQTYNLIGTVSFPTCKSKASTATINNTFITRTKNYIINPHINGLSDHEAQIIMIENIVLTKQINNITTKKGHQ